MILPIGIVEDALFQGGIANAFDEIEDRKLIDEELAYTR